VTQDSRQPGSDPLGDFQRWLLRSGARGFTRDVRDNLRKTFGYRGTGREDVWETATNEPAGEPPECEWCPLCRAARKFRESGPGLGSHLSSAGDVFATVVQDAVGAFDAVLAARPGSAEPAEPPDPPAAAPERAPGGADAPPGPAAGGAAGPDGAGASQEGTAHDPDDRS
jgi:hypothetical protein